MPTRLLRPLLAVALLLPALAGCLGKKKTPTEVTIPVAKSLIVVQGADQARQAGRRLPTPVTFRATSETGTAVKDLPITLVVESGGGTLDSASVKTDANGEAKVRWTLGTASVTQTIVATAPGVPQLRVQATALTPAEIVIVQGNLQTARAGTLLPVPIIVRVLGPNNIPMDSTQVALQIASGGGTISPQTVTTGLTGEATVKWTLGAVAGPNVAFVRVGTLDPTVLNATGTP